MPHYSFEQWTRVGTTSRCAKRNEERGSAGPTCFGMSPLVTEITRGLTQKLLNSRRISVQRVIYLGARFGARSWTKARIGWSRKMFHWQNCVVWMISNEKCEDRVDVTIIRQLLNYMRNFLIKNSGKMIFYNVCMLYCTINLQNTEGCNKSWWTFSVVIKKPSESRIKGK